jgi:hypothetical protein
VSLHLGNVQEEDSQEKLENDLSEEEENFLPKEVLEEEERLRKEREGANKEVLKVTIPKILRQSHNLATRAFTVVVATPVT